jgi:diguanylate cyclase (GGDEF)-like protein
VINDEFGHTNGDEALRVVARLCREETRDCDLVGRYGGEEFVILLPETGLEGALSVANRLRLRIDAETILTERGAIRLTVSVGVAALQSEPTTLDQMLDQADQAMYRAKNSGRNRVSA